MNRELALEAWKLMWTSRLIDETCKALHAAGTEVPNFHSATGQEALAVGMGLALEPEDYLLYHYRDFGALLAKGVALHDLACDLLLRSKGTNEGYGGIMHVVAPELGIVGRNGVFGSRFGISTGIGMACAHRRKGQAVACTFGEAEASRGPLYEALNLACLWDLPIVFIAQHNGFSVSTRTADMFAGGSMADLWRGFPMPVWSVDGNDIEKVYASVRAGLDHARNGLGPVFVEARTYRLDPHHLLDDHSTYRDAGEIADRWKDDPVKRFEQRLVQRGDVSSDELESLVAQVRSEVNEAFDAALQCPAPGVETIGKFVYFKDVAV